MKVLLAHDGHDWACKCWSARGMSGHKSAGPSKGMIYPSFVGTQTFVRMIEMCVESDFCHQIRMISNSGLFSFVLVRSVRSSVHIIKLPN
jgi:hypothetical protein